ncbi:DUF1559 domain-containing protein [Opitutaceae bacterium TAV4]|nr:DUF1559 domain-containing protein [Opitutaceae bacterium TAV4]RRJ99555.1 DUF1559 domain-containing protein [Opitutaceae bacterium TAV3]
MAIIGVLAGILIPVVGRVRTAARQTTCISNLRQIHIAIINYTNDHKGWFPDVNVNNGSSWVPWWLAVGPYLGNPSTTSQKPIHKVLQCPEVARIGGEMMTRDDRMELANYGANDKLGRVSNGSGVMTKNNNVLITAVRNPTRTILAGDNGMAASSPQADLNVTKIVLQSDRRHPSNGSALLWIDGHVTIWKDATRLADDPFKPNAAQDVWTP